MRTTILVLEDQFERIAWARREFPAHAIKWCPTVNELLAEAATADDIDMILLDHDLGFDHDKGYVEPWPKDANGMCGMDAADQLPDRCKEISIIVWSINKPAAQEMVYRLRDRGFYCVRIPFTDRPALRKAIAWCLEDADRIRKEKE